MNNLYISMEGELNTIEENNSVNNVLKAINIYQEYLGKLKKYIEENPLKTETRFSLFRQGNSMVQQIFSWARKITPLVPS